MALRCPVCDNDLEYVTTVNDVYKVSYALNIKELLKCQVCNLFYEKEALKHAIFSP
jgi:hypothetical protein